MATAVWAIIAMVVVSVFSAIATYFLKLASGKMAFSISKLLKNWKLIIGLFLYGIATLISLVALKAGDLSVLYPFVALQYVWTGFISMKFLKEKMTLMKWLGVCMIVLGVVLIGFKA